MLNGLLRWDTPTVLFRWTVSHIQRGRNYSPKALAKAKEFGPRRINSVYPAPGIADALRVPLGRRTR